MASTGGSLGDRNQLSGSVLGSSTGLRGDSVSVCGQQSTATALRTHLLCPPPLHPATPRQGPRSGAPKPPPAPTAPEALQLGRGESNGALAHWLPGRGCKRSSPTPLRPPSCGLAGATLTPAPAPALWLVPSSRGLCMVLRSLECSPQLEVPTAGAVCEEGPHPQLFPPFCRFQGSWLVQRGAFRQRSGCEGAASTTTTTPCASSSALPHLQAPAGSRSWHQ